MPLMNKMRDSMPVVFAGLAGVFLLMIVLEWGGQGTLFQSSFDQNAVGIINGERITTDEYYRVVNALAEQQKKKENKVDLSDKDMAEVRTQAWDELVREALVRKGIKDFNISVTDQELRDRVYTDPPQFLRKQFTDSTGKFHSDAYIQAIRDPRNDTLVRQLETSLREQMKQEKWQNLIMGSIQTSNAELMDRFTNTTAKASIDVLKIYPKTSMESLLPKVTDAQMQKYYESHKLKYKHDEGRKIRFVIFSQQPTARDSAQALDAAQSIKNRLANAPLSDVDSVAKEIAFDYRTEYKPIHDITGEVLSSGKPAEAIPGAVLVTQGRQGTEIVRITSVSDTGAISFHSKHILIGFGPSANKDSAKTLAMKLYNDLKAGADFGELARKYSSDPGSGQRGGDLGWTAPGQFVKEYENAVKAASPGELIPPFASQFGYHIVKLLEKGSKKAMGVSIPLTVAASSQTEQISKQQANIFREQAQQNGFDAAAKKLNYNIIEDAPVIQKGGPPIFGSDQFVAWVFSADEGDISNAVSVPIAKILVVAQLKQIVPAGIAPLEEVKEDVRKEVARDLRTESVAPLAMQVRNSIQAGDSLAAIAARDSGVTFVHTDMGPAEGVNALGGVEYNVNNYVFNRMKPGDISPPIKGTRGYYIVKLLAIQKATPEMFKLQRSSLIQSMFQEKSQRFFQKWFELAKKNAVIVDNRERLQIQ